MCQDEVVRQIERVSRPWNEVVNMALPERNLAVAIEALRILQVAKI
jgi:hypothetical protein